MRGKDFSLAAHGNSIESQASRDCLEHEYQRRCRQTTDVNEHLPLLRSLAEQCRHVTEFGTRRGNSTVAFLAAQPEQLICYDLGHLPAARKLSRLRGRTNLRLIDANVLEVEIEGTDLLFIDSRHTFEQLSAELRLHGDKARRFIVLHDTTKYGVIGEDGSLGLWPAVRWFLSRGAEWSIREIRTNNNGLVVLRRA